jgi:hypothetical protein
MGDDKTSSLDILGLKPVADSLSKVTTAVVDGSSAFLSRICLPAAEEYGLLLKDKVGAWRAANIASITKRAEVKLEQLGASDNVHAHPRIVSSIIESGAWIEDPIVQDYWAGLLTSSCTDNGDDDSNLIFVNLLSSLTKLQARLLDYACKTAGKTVVANGLIQAKYLSVDVDKLVEITGECDIHRLDRELDHLRELGLIHGGFEPYCTGADISPLALALHMYVRCNGSRQSPIEFFDSEIQRPTVPAS